MLRPTGHIIIGKYRFPGIISAEVVSTWENFTDIATLVVPRKVQFQGVDYLQAERFIKKGDKVEIWAGFDFQDKNIFSGYITKINPNENIEIEAEDAMSLLKKYTVTKSYLNVTLKQLLEDICRGVEVEAENIRLGKFRINTASPAKVLETLREEYGIYSWMRNGVLYSGFAYKPTPGSRHIFEIGRNVIDMDLSYEESESVPMQVKAVSILSDNSRIEIKEPETAPDDAVIRTFFQYGVKDKASLRVLAKSFLQKCQYAGYSGSIEVFGEPFCEHGDVAVLRDPKHPERTGAYLVKKVVRKTGVNGYFQDIYLHAKV